MKSKKIKITEVYDEEIINERIEYLKDFIENGVKREFFYSGELERVQSCVEGLSGSFSNLLILLMEKNILTLEDFRYIFYISDDEKLELEEK